MLDYRIINKWAPLLDADGAGGSGGSEGSEGQAGAGEGTEGGDAGGSDGKGTEGQESDPRKVPKYSDEDLDAIIQKKIDKIEAKAKAKADEATKLATMNATEKAEYETKKLREELDAYKRKEAIGNMIAESRTSLTEKGLSVPDEIIATLVVPEDAEATKKAVDKFAEVFNKTVDDALKDKMKGTPPKGGTPGKSLTREEIMAIPDGDARRKAIQENITLFEKK